MSASIGAAASAQSYQTPDWLAGTNGVNGSANADPIDELLQSMSAAGGASAQSVSSDPGATSQAGPPSTFDPNTFTALLSAQEQSGSGAANGGGGGGAGASAQSGSDSSSSGGTTTQTVTNPDGSITTITTYPDGTTNQSTSAPAQGLSAAAAGTDDGDEGAASGLQQLASLVQPLATAALAAAVL